MNIIFDDRLKELLLSNGVDGNVLCSAIDISKSQLNRWLNEGKLPTPVHAVSVADYFRCTLDYLVGLSDDNYTVLPRTLPEFGKRLRTLMQEFSTNPFRLGRETGIGRNAIYSWLNGKCEPSLMSVCRIAVCFGCTADYVIGRE